MPETDVVETPTVEVAPPTPDTTVEWQAHIPKEYSTDKVWEPHRSKPLGDLLKTHAEQAKLLGRSVQLPPANAKPEDLAKWKAANLPKLTGIVSTAPESPDAYKFDRPEAALDLGWDEEAEKHMRAVWHKAGMSNEQVAAVVNGYAEWQGKRLEKAEGYYQETKTALETEWGADYGPRMGRAVRFMKETGEEFGIPELMRVTGLGNNPQVIKWAAKMAQTSVEHGAMSSVAGEDVSADEFMRRSGEIRAEMEKTNTGSQRMNQLQAELDGLYQRHKNR
jgi:hypothetical protein